VRRLLSLVALVLVGAASLAPSATEVPRVEEFTPTGTAKEVRQAVARFSAPMVAFGDPRASDPFDIDCPIPGAGHWIDSRHWVYDLEREGSAGLRCQFALKPGIGALDGRPLGGERRFAFDTGGPGVLLTRPPEGDDIDESQVFLVAVDGPVEARSVTDHVHCEVTGLRERIGIELVGGETRERLLAGMRKGEEPGATLLRRLGIDDPEKAEPAALAAAEARILTLKCRRPLPPEREVQLVWGKGITGDTGLRTAAEQRFGFTTRPSFTASLSCERVNKNRACLPLLPITLDFSAQIPVEAAAAVRLVDGTGRSYPAEPIDARLRPFVDVVEFPGPFPEGAKLRVELPRGLVDDSGRALANAAQFPLAVATDEYPPLVKFAGEFGILEAREGGLLPLTVRNVEAGLTGRRLPEQAVPGRQRRVLDDLEIMGWLERVKTGMEPRGEWLEGKDGEATWKELTGADPVLGQAGGSERITVPVADDGKAFEVVAIPLRDPGFYVVELASPRLGAALLGEPRPRYVTTTALVTDLAVHLKWGREASLAWVTRLSDGSPVAGADVVVRRMGSGEILWRGQSDAQGIARVPAGALPKRRHDTALYVGARTADDMSFVLSDWDDGIRPWNFNLSDDSGDGPGIVHTVLDRALFRGGETVSMKHYVRRHTSAGIELAPSAPTALRILHLGSDEARELPVAFDAAGIAESSWAIPADARLGTYQIALKHGEDWLASGSFRVEQFRLPTMRALIQPPAAPLVAANEASLDLFVGYLSGGGAADLPVRLRTLVRPRELSYRDYPDFRFDAEPITEGIERSLSGADEEEDEAASTGPAQVLPLTLDREGAARITVPNLARSHRPQELVAELEYPDANGEQLVVSRRVPLWPAQLSLGLQAEHWSATKDRLRLKVVALDHAGQPLAGRQVEVALFERRSFTHRRRLVGGFYAYENRTETRRLQPACRGQTGTDGLLVCDLVPGISGEILLQARATDDAGNPAEATDEVWVSGEDQWFAGSESDRMDVLPDRREYESGDRARLQVRMPFRKSTALVTVEREGVIDAFVTELNGTDPVVELPLAASYAPNVYVSVLAVRGRASPPSQGGGAAGDAESPAPTALVDLGKPAFRLGFAKLDVGWAPHRLDVRVTPDREVYPVRDRAKVRVAVRRASGGDALPAPAEIAFAAVDEALLELRPNASWKLLEAMLQDERPIEVTTATAQMQVVGKRHYGRKAVPPGGGGGQQGARQLFDTLLLWQGRVALDAAGEAEVEVPLNDSLTAFRLVAVGSAGPDLFGTGEASVRTHQDLMLVSGLLPVVREGDRYAASFTVRNAAERTLRVEARAEVAAAEASLPALAPQALELAPGEARGLTWEVTAPPGVTELRWRVEAQDEGGAARDALQVAQRVAAVVPVRAFQATVSQVAPTLSLTVQRPADAVPDRGGLRVALQARLGEGLAGVADYMRAYPYSCLEQRVSKLVALGDRAGWESLVDILPRHQDRRGLFKYFASDWLEGDDALTVYLLALAHEAGWPLPPAAQGRALDGLQAFVEGKAPRRAAFAAPDLVVRKLAAIEALARYRRATPQQLESLTIDPANWPTSALLDWIGILQRVESVPEREAKLQEARRLLRGRLDLQGNALRFGRESADRLWWLMVSGDSNAARLLLAVVDDPAWREDMPRLARGVLGRLRRGHWDTTVANAWGTLAMTRFSERFEAEPVAGASTATLGEERKALDWAGGPRPAALDFPWPGDAPATLAVVHEGQGRPWAFVQSRAAIPLAAPLQAGFTVTRSVVPVEQRQEGRWTRGDVARVRLEIEARSDHTWVVVDDPIPAGASILGGGLGRDSALLTATERRSGAAWPVFEERRFDAYRAYYEHVPAGRWTLEYSIRLGTPGHFALPATRVEALYDPEVFAELPNAPVVVETAP